MDAPPSVPADWVRRGEIVPAADAEQALRTELARRVGDAEVHVLPAESRAQPGT